MPSLTLWAERDFDIDALERYCDTTKRGVGILLELWIAKASALSNMASLIEEYTNRQDDEQVLNNFLEDKVGDRIIQAFFQYARAGAPIEAQHIKTLKRCIADHDQKLPVALKQLRDASIRMSQLSTELNDARKEKTEADKKLLSEVTSKSELEKRFTPSAMGSSQLPASALNIINKCEERIKQAQEKQLSCGQRVTELRETLDEVTEACMTTRRESLQMIENLEKRKLVGIAVTSTEILNLQLVLSSSLTRETSGIISLEKTVPAAAVIPSPRLNQSTLSSAGSGTASVPLGDDWVERIAGMDPSERSLFELGQIAEALASHESDEEVKISDLEREIEKMKSQIRELEQGSGSFADRLAADYAGHQNLDESSLLKKRDAVQEKLMRVAPKFSLPLPLKNDCYAADFWRGSFAIEENHESDVDFLVDLPWIVPDIEEASTTGGNSGSLSKSPIATPGVPLSDREWDFIAYEYILLGYFEITTRYPHLLTSSHWTKLKTAIHTIRLKLKIPTKVHEQLTELLLPDSVNIQDEIAPLDYRFRLLRLIVVGTGAAASAEQHVDSFVRRQVAFLDLCVRCTQREDQSGTFDTTVSPLMAVVVSSILNTVPIEADILLELMDALGTFAEESCETSQLVIPRGVLHQLISRLWRLCVSLDQENGLSQDVNLVAALINNFLTGRQYPYHCFWLGLGLWEEALRAGPSVPAQVARQIADIFKLVSGNKWLDKMCGDLFWFGRGAAGASSIHSALGGSPKNVNDSFRSAEPPSPTSDLTSRVLGFDMAYILKLTLKSRDSIVSALCDYRRTLEPDALENSFELFRNMMNRTNTVVPTFLWPAEVDWNQYLKTMGEHFISESARCVCNRLVEPEKFLDSVSVARAHANDESRGIWMGEVTGAVWQVIFELACELEVYSLAWTKNDLLSKHRLIWTKGMQSRIRAVVDLMHRDDDLWLPDRVPPGGQDLLAVLQVWQRISGDGDLTEIIRPKISRALLLHLDKVERDSLPACLHNNHGDFGQCWGATRPPLILHSTKCVDLWTTIFTSLQACIEAASVQMSMGTCAQMVVRCLERYCDNAREGFPGDVALAHPLLVKARRAFTRLLMHSEDESELPEIFKSKKKRKNRLFKRDAANTSAYASNMSADESDGDIAPASGGAAGRAASLSLGSEGLNLIGDNHLFLSDYLVVTSRLASQDATALMVRLHDLAFSLGEMEKARSTLTEAIEKEHVKLSKLYKSQAKFSSVIGEDVQPLPKLPEEVLRGMMETIEQGMTEASQIITNTADIVAKYMGINLVFIQERENIFERLYMPTPRDFPLAVVIKNYKSIVLFAQMVPLKWRTEILRSVLSNFVMAWVYVVCDMVTRGRVFKEADAAVMRNDFDALSRLAEDLGLKHDAQSQDLLRFSGSFPDYVSGSSPTELKAECERALVEPTEKSKSKSRLAKVAPANIKKK